MIIFRPRFSELTDNKHDLMFIQMSQRKNVPYKSDTVLNVPVCPKINVPVIFKNLI